MKAVVLKSFGDSTGFELQTVPIPEVKSNEVRVKILASSFNPFDYKCRKGLFGGTTPMILGGDFSGVVDAVGSNVKTYVKGDEVFGLSLGTISSNGAYAQYVSVTEHFITKKPASISHAEAAGLVIAGGTAVEVLRKCPLQENSSVLVIGASGGVGSAVIQLLAVHKNITVFTLAGSAASAEYLHNQGIPKDKVILYSGLTNDEIRQKILDANNSNGIDIVIDLFGGDSKKLGFSVLNYDGTIVSIVEEPEASYVTPLYPSQNPRNLFGVNGTLTMCFLAAPAFLGEKIHPHMAQILAKLAETIEKGILKPISTKVMGELSAETVIAAHKELEAHHTKGKMVIAVSQ